MDRVETHNTKRRVVLRVLCNLLALVFFIAAGMKFFATAFEVSNFAHFGYAPWFMYVIAALELLGGCLLAWRRWTGLGALLMLPVVIGAAASHIGAGDGVGMAIPALVILLLLAVVTVAHRRDLLQRFTVQQLRSA